MNTKYQEAPSNITEFKKPKPFYLKPQDVANAITEADITGRELLLLLITSDVFYRFQGQRPQPISLSDILIRSGLGRSVASDKMKNLISYGMLIRHENGYIFQNDLSKWSPEKRKRHPRNTDEKHIRETRTKASGKHGCGDPENITSAPTPPIAKKDLKKIDSPIIPTKESLSAAIGFCDPIAEVILNFYPDGSISSQPKFINELIRPIKSDGDFIRLLTMSPNEQSAILMAAYLRYGNSKTKILNPIAYYGSLVRDCLGRYCGLGVDFGSLSTHPLREFSRSEDERGQHDLDPMAADEFPDIKPQLGVIPSVSDLVEELKDDGLEDTKLYRDLGAERFEDWDEVKALVMSGVQAFADIAKDHDDPRRGIASVLLKTIRRFKRKFPSCGIDF